jgi:branched-chain amino acid transport system permease protein
MVSTTVVLLIALIVFIERTMVGWALESVAFDPSVAGLYGVNVTGIMVVTWMVAGGVAGLAGSLLAGVSSISREVALVLAVKGIAAAVLGGLGSLPGAIVGALLVAFGEALFVNFVSSVWANAFVFFLLFVALSVRPQGLFGLPRQVERT